MNCSYISDDGSTERTSYLKVISEKMGKYKAAVSPFGMDIIICVGERLCHTVPWGEGEIE